MASELRKKMINGFAWSAVEKYSSYLVSLAISMILSRILAPSQFGLVAIVSVLINFFRLFCSMGVAPAIIQRNDLTDKDYDIFFTLSLLLGLFLASVFFSSAKLVARFYDNPELIRIVRILSVNLFFAAANMVPNALMCRNLRFKQMAKRTLSIQISTGIISIIAALKGAGVYSLLISPVITSVAVFSYNFHLFPRRVTSKIQLSPVKKIFSYSAYQFGFEFINYFSRNLDKLIIGKAMSATELGYYEKSYRLMQMPMQTITHVFNPVLQPVLKDFQNEKQVLARKYNEIIRLLSAISFPVGGICCICGREIILLFFGSQWQPAVAPFSILALSLPLQIVLATNGAIFQSANATKHQFFAGIRGTLLTVSGFCIGAFCFKKLEAVAWGWTIALLLNFFNFYIDLYYFVLKSSLLPVLKSLIWPLVNLVGILAIGLLPLQLPLLPSLLIKVSLSAVLSFIVIQFTGRIDIIGYLKKLINKKKRNV